LLFHYLGYVNYALLLSGGVDSSTALAELVSSGHSVHAYYLKVWLEDELDYLGACPWEEDLEFARGVCEQYDVELTVVPLQLQYHEAVVTYTIAELKRGHTPSPDIFCNERIKFGAFFSFLTEGGHLEPDARIASGHYAIIDRSTDQVLLRRSPDPVKDQTYFLSHLSQRQLSRLEFPIGHYTKAEIRERAQELGVPAKDRRDSQGICFLGNIRYPDFIRHYLGEQEGSIVEYETGERLGSHRGYWFYTIGQRQGLGLSGGPWYVVAKDCTSNTVTVSHAEQVSRSARTSLSISDLHWTAEPLSTGMVDVKLRHGPRLHRASARWLDSDSIGLELEEADRGIAPGQFAVLYHDDICLGSGTIEED
jgi:tRNA-specific 2-thiouridylase